MSYVLDFRDVKTKGHVDKNKIASCSFSKVNPGDYILINFYDQGVHDDDGWSNSCNCGNLFVKVISVKLPHDASFFRGSFDGQINVELPNGKRTDLLNVTLINVFPEVHSYFFRNCYPEREEPIHIICLFSVYNGGDPELQKLMREEYARRERRRAELFRQNEEKDRADRIKAEKQRRAEKEAEEARLREKRQRNDVAANRETENLFRNQSALSGFNFFVCPNCGTNCRVPVKGKTLHIICPKCKNAFDRFS